MNNKLKNKIKQFKSNAILTSILLMILGFIVIIFNSQLTAIISYLIGTALCIWGGIGLILYFTDRSKRAFSSNGFVSSAILFLLGVVILSKPNLLLGLIDVLLGIAILIDGLVKLQYAIDAYRTRIKGWPVVLGLAVLTIVLGILVFNEPITTEGVMHSSGFMIFCGISLLLAGITDMVTVFYVDKEIKKNTIVVSHTTFEDIK